MPFLINLAISAVITGICMGVAFLVFPKLKPKNHAGTAAIVFVVCVWIVSPGLVSFFGEKRPGSWVEREKYSAEVYANVFPENSESKNYRVVAKVDALSKTYAIRSFKFPNGSQVKFDSLERFNFDDFGECSNFITDSEGRTWWVELTGKLAD